MFLALLRAHLNPRYAQAKMILSRAKNIFMPANVNSIVILDYMLLSLLQHTCPIFMQKNSRSQAVATIFYNY